MPCRLQPSPPDWPRARKRDALRPPSKFPLDGGPADAHSLAWTGPIYFALGDDGQSGDSLQWPRLASFTRFLRWLAELP